MTIKEIIQALEEMAHPHLQEPYDNSGLLCGDKMSTCTGITISLDCTEAVIDEAIQNGCNLVVSHHPIVFKGLKTFTGKNYVERTIIKAIKADIAIYAIHTNLDNVLHGVNASIAGKLGVIDCNILAPKSGDLRKLSVFVPHSGLEILRSALFAAGAGEIGNYSHCSFAAEGMGSFLPEDGAKPVIGQLGSIHKEPETKLEVIFPGWKQGAILSAMIENHPYETVAHDIYRLENEWQETGSGMVGRLPEAIDSRKFLEFVKVKFNVPVIRHTALINDKVQKIAFCGGAGSFLVKNAIAAGADIFITGDMKYHEFFDADDKIIIADIGHYESEQFTIDLLYDLLTQKFTNFAILKTGQNTNPVSYF